LQGNSFKPSGMKKAVISFILLLAFLPLFAQRKTRERKPSETWWTMYAQT
jgi:hypothetical protein